MRAAVKAGIVWRMAAARHKIRAEDVHGFKYFNALRGLIERLHFVGTARDKAGNPDLHMDQYCTLILLWFFSPIVDSLRGLQQASELDKVRKYSGVGRASLGSLSEGVAVFDPEPLKEIAHELYSWLPKAKGASLCGYRLHTQFEVLRGVPSRIDVTPASPKGDADERAVLARTVDSDHMYITDRSRSSGTDRDREGHTASQRRQEQRRTHRVELRRLSEDRDESPRSSRQAHQRAVSSTVAD